MLSPRPVDVDWASLTPEQQVVIVPPSVAGLATAVMLHRALDDPFFALTDPLDLVDHLGGLAGSGVRPARLIVAGLPIDPADLEAATARLSDLGGTPIEWYDDHIWPPDAQAALWPFCRRAEIGPDVPAPVHYVAHQILDRARLGLRLIDLVENGTDSSDAWVRSRYRLLAGVLRPERDNLVPDFIAATAAEADELSEVEWEIVAEQGIAEKTIERLVREELEVASAPGGTRVLLADLGEWSASPYLSLACRRFFTYQVLIRVIETGRLVVEKLPSYPGDLLQVRSRLPFAELRARVRATRQELEIDVEPEDLEAALRALLSVI